MFTIFGGKTEFSQWEQGQRVTNPKLAVGDKVRFWNASGETHPMIAYMHEGVVVADVPNDLLQHCSPILVELCGDPECLTRFIVNAQDKPAGYVFKDNTHCAPAPSGGGVSRWNDIPDKPFVKVGGDTLTWDGNTEGLENYVDVMYKVSDAVPTIEDFANGFSVFVSDEGDMECPSDFAKIDDDGAIMLGDPEAFLPYAAIVNEGAAATLGCDPGVYFLSIDFSQLGGEGVAIVTRLTIPGYTGFAKEQIDPKVLPEALQFGKTTVQGDTLEWDGNTEGLVAVDLDGMYMVRVSDAVPSKTDVANGGTFVQFVNGKSANVEFSAAELIYDGNSIIHAEGAAFCVVAEDNLEDDGIVFPEKGTYLQYVPSENIYVSSLTIPGYTGFTKTEIKTIEPEYLPTQEWTFTLEDDSTVVKKVVVAE